MALTEGIKRAAIKVGAPAKSVKRWLKVGPYRKNAATISPTGITMETPITPNASVQKVFSHEPLTDITQQETSAFYLQEH
jgi:hypothetical protein